VKDWTVSKSDNMWVFGYGSLMWNPGFAYLRHLPGKLHGFHRSLCIYSHQYRGTPDRPGLVFGLDHGGSCRGMVFEVDVARWPETLAYLREREQLGNVYIEAFRRVRIETAQEVRALAFTVNRSHAQYAGKLPADELFRLAQQGKGQFGACADYVRNTVAHLRELGVQDAQLDRLLARLDGEKTQ
jgi:glutathione-specific gamma-glutamylcyclotransferase